MKCYALFKRFNRERLAIGKRFNIYNLFLCYCLWASFTLSCKATFFFCRLMVRTDGLHEGRLIRMLCLCMKSCGGIASVEAGGTKVWMRRNGHQREMESSFRGGQACTHVRWLFTLGWDTTRWCIPALTVGSPDPDPCFHAWLFIT